MKATSNDIMIPPNIDGAVVLCPACKHTINRHTSAANGCCLNDSEVEGQQCLCFWSPNDIAYQYVIGNYEPLVLHHSIPDYHSQD